MWSHLQELHVLLVSCFLSHTSLDILHILYLGLLLWLYVFFPGVSVLAVGVSNADIEELNRIAAPTSYKNIFYSPTFDNFPSIEREFMRSLCSEELLSEFKEYKEARQKKV